MRVLLLFHSCASRAHCIGVRVRVCFYRYWVSVLPTAEKRSQPASVLPTARELNGVKALKTHIHTYGT